MEHKELADKVMKMLLNGDDKILILLRKQYEASEIVSVKSNEVGFYINYKVNEYVINEHDYNNTFQIGDVDGNLNGVAGALGFILYIRAGYIVMLEGYTNALDYWPSDDRQIELSYDTGADRDLLSLKMKWMK